MQYLLAGVVGLILAMPLPGLAILRWLRPEGHWADWLLNRSLNGITLPKQDVRLSAKTWLKGDYQRSVTAWLNENFAGRELGLRLYNQMLWSAFRKSYMAQESIVAGTDGELFERDYLDHYNYFIPMPSDADVDVLAGKMADLRDRLQQRGGYFLVLFTPSKATTMPEFIPPRNRTNLRGQPARDYERLKAALDRYKVDFIDGPVLSRAAADQLGWTAFPKTGIHWSHPIAFSTAAAVLNAVQSKTDRTMAHLQMSGVTIDHRPHPPDEDLALLLNLIWTPRDRYIHAAYSRTPGSPSRTGRITLVGGSFVHLLNELWVETQAFEQISFYYYYKASLYSFPGGAPTAVDQSRINWAGDFEQADAVILEINESKVGDDYVKAFLAGSLAGLPERPGGSIQPKILFYSETWHGVESNSEHVWHWSKGDARIALTNAATKSRTATFSLKLVPYQRPRTISIYSPRGELIWQGLVKPGTLQSVPGLKIELRAGHNELLLKSDVPAENAGQGDPRALDFAVYDFAVLFDPAEPR